MKISIGINGYKEYKDLEKREKFCIESLLKCKKDNIGLYNICFEDENISYEGFKTLNNLKNKSSDIIREYFKHNGLKKEYELKKTEIDHNKKNLPSVKEIFDVLASTDCDYFLFLNNDIIISNRLFKEIENDIECYPISRMHIDDLKSLSDTPKLESYSVHGFDAFLIKKETWLKIRNNFEDLILGSFYWDTYFATLFNILCKCKNLNKLPPVCFHIEHNSTSSKDSVENYYNEDVFKRNLLIGHLWFSYVHNVLLKRPTVNECKWYYPHEDELSLEKRHFKQLDVPLLFDPNFKKIEVSTQNKNVDLFIPVAEKDEIKLQYVIEYANKHLTFKNIYVCSPHTIKNKITSNNITYINDKDVLDIPDKSFIKFRPNWTYQQFLKLFFRHSESDYYFALDSDTIVIKDLPFFEGDHPIWYYGWKQNHFPYFLFNRNFFNLDKSLTHTGIGDLGLFNKNITQTFLNRTGIKSPEELLKIIGPKTNVVFHFSEYETYSNFANEFYRDLYVFRHLEQENKGRDLNQGESWTDSDIKQTIENYKNSNKSILSLHSWKI